MVYDLCQIGAASKSLVDINLINNKLNLYIYDKNKNKKSKASKHFPVAVFNCRESMFIMHRRLDLCNVQMKK